MMPVSTDSRRRSRNAVLLGLVVGVRPGPVLAVAFLEDVLEVAPRLDVVDADWLDVGPLLWLRLGHASMVRRGARQLNC